MRLSRTVTYALQAAVHLARMAPGVTVTANQLARTGRMPKRFLPHILRGLVTHGVLESARGADGGYYLSRSPSEVTLYDIVEAFDSSLNPTVPTVGGISVETRKQLATALRKASQSARQELQKLTLADLIGSSGAN